MSHLFPHCPQFAASLAISMDFPSQYVGIEEVDDILVHVPEEHFLFGPHLFPHCPQFAESMEVSMDFPSQYVGPVPVVHEPD